MRTTSKVLAIAGAGSALAGAPPAYSQGGAWGSSDGAAYGSSSSGAAAVSGSASQSWSYSFGSLSGSASGYAGASGWGTGYPAASSSVPVYPGGYSSPAGAGSFPPARGPSAGGPPHGGPSVVTQYTTLYESGSACAAGDGATATVTITETGTVTGVPVGPVGGSGAPSGPGAPSGYPAGPGGEPSRSPGEVYTTIYTTIYETSTAAGVSPYTYAGWSSSYTHYEKSTCTEETTKVVTHPYPSTEPAGAGSASGYPSGGAGGYPSGGAGGFPSGGAGGYPSGGAGGYPSGGAGAGSASGYPSGGAGGYPSGGAGGYPSASGSVPVGPGSVSASWSIPAGSGYPGGPTGTGYPSGGYPTGYPTGTGSHPKPSGCTPCEGQKGSLPFCGLDINTNWYDEAPKTCKTVEYTFTVTNETVSPDGVSRMGLVVNGQLPGPTIHASWGDTVKVTVINKLPPDGRNGTTFHFHGIRQNGTNEYDGVGSLTQCPIAPGESMTYEWVANSYGTSWWHAHYALQTYEGIFGPIQIDGPLQDDVSYDGEQFFLVQDWSHRTADEIYEPSLLASNPNNTRGPTLDTGLINGLNVWENGGSRFQMTVTAGKTYRLRLINTAIQSTFKFYVDQHLLTVFAMDFVPITPYQTNMVGINIGQRYDILLKADQPVANYWVRSDNQQPCGTLINADDIKGVIHYEGADSSDPTSQAYGYAPSCLDEPYANLKPIVPWSAGAVTTELDETVVVQPNSDNMYRWYISGTTGAPNTFLSQWGDPTLVDIYDNGQVPDYSGNLAIEVPNLGEWVYIVIDTPIPAPHPIHLHGHDFLILAQDTGTYSSSVSLNLVEPPRRDVAVLPTDPINGLGGYLVIAYYTSNPGVWLLHCHIGWHNTMGFALQIIENLEGIKKTVKNPSQLHDTCSSWASYAKEYSVVPDNFEDSGV